jgi:hypothetical protein
MDRRLRELERAAIAGDVDAAFQYYLHSSRSRTPRERIRGEELPRDIVNLEMNNFNGPIELVVINETYIIVSPATEPDADEWRGRSELPVYINNVPYLIRRHFYYYPDAEPYNWIPHDPEDVAKAKDDFEDELRRRGVGTWMPWNTWQDVLGRGDIRGSFARVPNNQPPTASAHRIVDDALPRVVTSWANLNPEMLQKAGLTDTNNEILDVESTLDIIEEKARALRQQLGELVIDELRLGRREF